MPVWHAKTAPLRASGELVVIGITEEQHPDRCQLYAQWQGIDWPILWDPFNLTESAAVPVVMAVDEHGVIQPLRLDPRRFEEQFVDEFLAVEFPAPGNEPATPHEGIAKSAVGRPSLAGDDILLTPNQAMSRLMWYEQVHGTALPAKEIDHAVRSLGHVAQGAGAQPADHFRHGVALRLRYDSPHHHAEDFQSSLDAWTAALAANPGQYIWRRRIQQWGPRLDKPYPFYDWVARAIEEVRARGQEPVAVHVPLTGSEVAGATKEIPRRAEREESPDPGRELPRDEAGLVTVETAAALHTGIVSQRVREPAGTARVHVVLRPDAERDVHWTNDAGPTLVWISVPQGWDMKRSLHTLEMPEGESSNEVRHLDFEVRPPSAPPGEPPPAPADGPLSLRGTAFYYVCEGASGECVYLAQDFHVAIPLPKK